MAQTMEYAVWKRDNGVQNMDKRSQRIKNKAW